MKIVAVALALSVPAAPQKKPDPRLDNRVDAGQAGRCRLRCEGAM
jgi:hypothetical protein